ncbi:MAG TPA: hypothetical protein VLL75_17160 [Vicinamibacteria bacterium]|jgi:hypothetical protein|nr:hypothetical protein [Vicinamibacteria bacterium]
MPLSEPTTLLSDWVLALVAAGLGTRLYRAGPREADRARRLWAAAFLAGAAGALAGGAVHGFAASLPPLAHAVLWKTVLVTVGLADSLVLAGTVLASFGGSCRRACLAATAGTLAIYLALVSRSDDVRLAVGHGALAILAALALALTRPDDARRLGGILLALGASAAGLAAQRSGVGAGILNHNDLCHVLQTAALWPLYCAGRRLQDASRRPGAQRPSFSRKSALSRLASNLW